MATQFSALDWHQRFLQQSQWTQGIRDHFFGSIAPGDNPRFLEVGCGTGAILNSIYPGKKAKKFGLDICFDYLCFANQKYPFLSLTDANGYAIPFKSGTFDVVFCHFLLLWLKNPMKVVLEMKRVARNGGRIAFFAEPDYSARIDFPPELTTIGKLQRESLIEQGANPDIGRQAAHLLAEANCHSIQVGVLGGHWDNQFSQEEWEMEWKILKNDLHPKINPGEFSKLKDVDLLSWQKGERILFVPTFYAFGIV